MNSCYNQSENNTWVGFDHVVVCDDNEDVIIALLTDGAPTDYVDQTMQMINDAGGACNYVLPFAFGDPIIENLCCESLSNFNPSDMCESGDCIQDCYGMWLDNSTIDEFFGNGQCDDFMNCEMLNFDGGDCNDPIDSAFVDCFGNPAPADWVGDGWCDDIMNCEMLNFDGGDCNPYQCDNPNACNYGQEEDCIEPEGNCDCEGNAPNYSNIGISISMEGYEYNSGAEDNTLNILASWSDSDESFEIPVSMTSDGGYYADFNSAPGNSFTFVVLINGEAYGHCDGNPFTGQFNDLDSENPCWISNNTIEIAPFNCQYISTCNGDIYTELEWIVQSEYLLGNGYCDHNDGWSLNFNCEEFNYENGDCTPVNCNEYTEIDVPLELVSGWNMFGYTCWEPMNAIDAFTNISNKIEIVKDGWGMAYIPDWEFNGLGDFEYGKGYQIKMFEDVYDFQFCKTIIRQ